MSILLGLLVFLIFCSAFFSASETSMMAINRYRLRHLATKKHKAAQRVSQLLERPDRLIGVILLGNNFVNILASSICTIIFVELLGDVGIAVATVLLTVVILIFGEVTPKTLAALYPERVAFPTSALIRPMLAIFYPLVWSLNTLSNGLISLLGISHQKDAQHLNTDELRMVVHEAGGLISSNHQKMLLGILDLENVSVEDIMVPRHEIVGIDIESSLETITEQLANCQHTRLLLYRESIDDVIGMIHTRKVLRLLNNQELTRESLTEVVKDLYFIPEGTPLNTQLLNFQRHKQRIGLVVNEYGDIQGLVTLEDILEEIVGEFTTSPDMLSPSVHPQSDGSFLVDGSITVRELVRVMKWNLPTEGPRTLNGLILEYLEMIPESGTSFLLQGHPIEIVHVANNAVKMARIFPRYHKGKGILELNNETR